MRYLTKLIILLLLFTGCSKSFETTEPDLLIPSKNTTISPLENVHSDNRRQPVILSHDTEGFYDEYSLFGYPIFISLEDGRVPDYLSNIYRTIHPWSGEEDVFEALSRRIEKRLDKEPDYVNMLGDILPSFLLTEESVNLSDEELRERLSNITPSHVFSKHTDTTSYRLIAVNADPERVYVSYQQTWSYYVQVWDDEHIWAQPLCEDTELIFNQAIFVTIPGENELVIVAGYTRSPPGSGFASAGTGFMFEDGIWAPMIWNEIYEEVTPIENLRIASDGIITVIHPSWFEIPLDGPRFSLKLMEDGSFWADYSISEDLPYKDNDLLFRLR